MSALEWLDAVRADLDAVSRFGHELDERVTSREGRSVLAIASDLDDAHEALDNTALDRLDRMERALRGVLEMHRPRPNTVSALSPYPLCECGLEWGDDGCPTAVTIREALSDE